MLLPARLPHARELPAQGELPAEEPLTTASPRQGSPGVTGGHAPSQLWAMDVAYQVEREWSRRLAGAGAVVVPGVEMLLHQAAPQVEAMTGLPAPLDAMRRALATGRADLHP